jgi:hypothetical protein
LADFEVSGHDTSGLVVETPFRIGAIENCKRQVGTPVGGTGAKSYITGHGHVQSRKAGGNAGVLGLPVRHNLDNYQKTSSKMHEKTHKSLEIKFVFQKTVQEV